MLIQKPKSEKVEYIFNEVQKMAIDYLPEEQVRKFIECPQLIELELANEQREPEIENTVRDLFDALHEHNTPKLLKVMQGDKQRIFYAFKKQLENKMLADKDKEDEPEDLPVKDIDISIKERIEKEIYAYLTKTEIDAIEDSAEDIREILIQYTNVAKADVRKAVDTLLVGEVTEDYALALEDVLNEIKLEKKKPKKKQDRLRLTKREAKILRVMQQKYVSLLTLSLIKD